LNNSYSDHTNTSFISEFPGDERLPHQKPKTVFKHLALFLLTVLTVSLTGASFVGFSPSLFPASLPTEGDFYRGLLFAVLLLSFLGVHEFGHYFAALYHNIKVTPPYFIPIPLGIGTLGAVIRIKQKINHTHKMFDIGAAGPLAGFVVSLFVLIYGFSTLPEPSYVENFAGHESTKEYVAEHNAYPPSPLEETEGDMLVVGNTLLYSFLASMFENVPPMWEMYHYPFLFAGWLGLFFTALNLTPIGQLDGGHILYSLLGFKKHRFVARVFFGALVTLASIEAIPFLHFSLIDYESYHEIFSWIIWALVLFFLLRKAYREDFRWISAVLITSLGASAFYLYLIEGAISSSGSLIWVVWSFFIAYLVKIEHPPALYEQELNPTRKYLGWLNMAIFILCISPNPLYLI
jgi:membrane-associated protease RseP (regulator of RpoE activity)